MKGNAAPAIAWSQPGPSAQGNSLGIQRGILRNQSPQQSPTDRVSVLGYGYPTQTRPTHPTGMGYCQSPHCRHQVKSCKWEDVASYTAPLHCGSAWRGREGAGEVCVCRHQERKGKVSFDGKKTFPGKSNSGSKACAGIFMFASV